MEKRNLNNVTEFVLLGFIIKSELRIFLFIIICITYILTISANILIVVVIKSNVSLHKPMYFFIGMFSFLEIWYPTATVPKFLSVLLMESGTISINGCITQLYLHFSLGATENLLLLTMSFDRYVAICIPLRYATILSNKLCVKLAAACWVAGFLFFVLTPFQVSNLTFCGSNRVDHYYCDFAPLISLSCSDVFMVEWTFFVMVTFGLLGCFVIIIISYICILVNILRLSSASGRKKAFSTCASHFTVMLIYYGTTIFMFVRPPGSPVWRFNKIVSTIPSVVTPLLNPIIYTLRNKEMKNTMQRTLRMPKGWQN